MGVSRCSGLDLYPDLLRQNRCRCCTIDTAAVKAGPRVAVAVGRSLYDTHCQLYRTTMKVHWITPVSTKKEQEESTSEQETVFGGRM